MMCACWFSPRVQVPPCPVSSPCPCAHHERCSAAVAPSIFMTDYVTIEFGGPSSSRPDADLEWRRDAEHVFWWTTPDTRVRVCPKAVLRCKVLRELVDCMKGNATIPFCTPEVEAWCCLGQELSQSVPQSVTALCSALRVRLRVHC